jgi:hypothetical protein
MPVIERQRCVGVAEVSKTARLAITTETRCAPMRYNLLFDHIGACRAPVVAAQLDCEREAEG